MATAGYPPPQESQDAMYALNSSTRLEIADDARQQLLRTPSPTPSEMRALKFRLGEVDWKTMASRKFWLRKEWLCALLGLPFCAIAYLLISGYYVILVIILIITALASMYHKQIVTWLTPYTKWVYEYVSSLVLQRRYNDTLQFGIRMACPGCRSVCDILSSRNMLFYCPSGHR
jgi:hypothetical protein